MRNWEQDKPARQQLVRLVANEIETIRLKRREQWSGQQHPELKTFTQEELNSEAYGAYKNMLLGRTVSLPSREQLLHIADYLECNLAERNDLLVAARYLPDLTHLPEDQRRRAVEDLTRTLQTMQLPAYVADVGWLLHTANTQFLAMVGVENLSLILGNQLVGMNCTFDPAAPTRPAMALNQKTWQRNALVTKTIWQRHNAPFRYEAWYAAHISMSSRYPGFTDIWGMDQYTDDLDMTYVLISDSSGGPVTLRPLILSPFNVPYPFMLVFLPADEPANHFLQQLKEATLATETPWDKPVEQMLPSVASAR